MYKKTLWTLGVLIGAIAIAYASTVVYSQKFVDSTGLAYTQNFDLNMKNGGRNGRSIDNITMQAVYSSATIAPVAFTDGGLATGSLTVASVSDLVGIKAAGTIMVTSTSTLKNAVVTVNGVSLRARYDWFPAATTALTAANIAYKVNLITGVDAEAVSNVIYTSAAVAGVAGNSISLSKFGAGLSVSGAALTGGTNQGYAMIGTTRLTQGTDWTVGATTITTASDIATAINANSRLSGLVVASTSAAVITITARALGSDSNLALAGWPSASISTSGVFMTGGSDPAWALNSRNITKANHHLVTALPVVFTTGTLVVGGLTNGSTYYAIPVNSNVFQLSSTSTGAIAGSGIILTSTSSAGPHTYTLTPSNIAGTFGFKWQYSNDNTNWLDISISSITFGTPYTAGNIFSNIGAVNFNYLRLKYTAGTAGAMALSIDGYGTNNN